MLVSGGGEYLEAQSPPQLVLTIKKHNRARRNRDPGDLEINNHIAAEILTGRSAWAICADGTVYFTRPDATRVDQYLDL